MALERIKVKLLVIPLHNLYRAYGRLFKVGKVGCNLELLYLFHWPEGSCPSSDPAVLDADIAQVALQVILFFVDDVVTFLVRIILVVLICFFFLILSIELLLFILTVFFFLLALGFLLASLRFFSRRSSVCIV